MVVGGEIQLERRVVKVRQRSTTTRDRRFDHPPRRKRCGGRALLQLSRIKPHHRPRLGRRDLEVNDDAIFQLVRAACEFITLPLTGQCQRMAQ